MSPLPPTEEEDEERSDYIQDDAGSKATSLTSLRSNAGIVEQETEQYGFSIIEILTKISRLVR